MPDTDDVTKLLKDALYVTVGLGVIAFQKAQVQRQELRKQVSSQLGDARDTVSKAVDARVRAIEDRLDDLEARLPDPAGDVTRQVRKAARDLVGRRTNGAS
jgi:hypothetical protein